MRGEHAAIAREVPARRWHQSRETRDEGERRKVHRGGAIGPGLLEVQPHRLFRQDVQSVIGQRGTQEVATQALAAGLVVGGDTRSRLQVESVGAGAEVAVGHGAVVRVEHDADGHALGGWACRRSASGGGDQQFGEQRVLLAQSLFRDDGDLAVSRRSDQGDDATALEEAQEAPAARSTSCLMSAWLGAVARWNICPWPSPSGP
jgi:hypothetical protein